MLLYPASIQTNKKIKTHRVDVIEDVELFCSSSGGTFENEDDAGDFFRFHPVKKEAIHQEKVCWVDVVVNIWVVVVVSFFPLTPQFNRLLIERYKNLVTAAWK